MKVKIGPKTVGNGEPCFIIAEAGVNHNGSIKRAKKLIDAAKWAGADAVKFQIFKAEDVATPGAEKAEYQKTCADQEESQYDMIKKLELGEEEFCDLAQYAKDNSILFLSTPFSPRSANLLEEIDVPAYKIASGEITNIPLLEHIARKSKPIILSTGMSTMEEIGEALEAIKQAGGVKIVLLHCITSYPARTNDVNLRAMETLRQAFEIPVGFSDHTLGLNVSIAAAALDACIIEKHFTLNRNLQGPDHRASLEPAELKELIKGIREVDIAKGSGIKLPTAEEEKIKHLVRRSIVAAIDIPAGSTITEDMLDLKRPGTGIEPKHLKLIVGKKAIKEIHRNCLLAWDHIKE
jgi:N-acetylneuraminate synthase/N,N'-diacetyllegionaminate synthase